MHQRSLYIPLLTHLRETKKITMLIGARQTGKTTLMQHCRQQLSNEDRQTVFFTMEQISLREKLDRDPEYLLSILPVTNERILVCIDEIQYLKNPTNFLKLMVDLYSERLQLFVTGSSSFYIDHRFIDSLAGRKKIFTLYPLSFREFLVFRQQDEMIQYLRLPLAEHIQAPLKALWYEYLLYGGYPELVLMSNASQKVEYLNDLLGTYIYKDIKDAGIKMPSKYMDIMRLLAAQTGKLVNMSEIASQVGLSVSAVQSYIYTMQSSFHLGLIRPFSKNIRKEISKMPKVYFYDTGVRNLLINDFRPIPERGDKGEVIENTFFQYFVSQYRIDEVKFWHSNSDQEIDFIIQEQAAFEIKVDKTRFRKEKHLSFHSSYPHISLVCLDEGDGMVR